MGGGGETKKKRKKKTPSNSLTHNITFWHFGGTRGGRCPAAWHFGVKASSDSGASGKLMAPKERRSATAEPNSEM